MYPVRGPDGKSECPIIQRGQGWVQALPRLNRTSSDNPFAVATTTNDPRLRFIFSVGAVARPWALVHTVTRDWPWNVAPAPVVASASTVKVTATCATAL